MLTMVLALNLVGCGGVKQNNVDAAIKVTWNNGVMNFGGKDVASVIEYTGTSLKFNDLNGDWTCILEQTDDLTMSSVNSQGIEIVNMDTYQGMKTYTEYLGTQHTVNYNAYDNYWYIARVTNNGGINVDLANKNAKDTLSNIALTYGATTCEMNKSILIGDGVTQLTIRNDAVLIPGLLKVSLGTHESCTNPYTAIQGKKQFNLMKGSVGEYDVYTYNEFLIQVPMGLPIEEYIEFK